MILFLILALLGFIASIIVHASTFAAAPPFGMRQAWPLHIGIFIVFLPMVLNQKQVTTGRRSATLREQYPNAPRWMRFVLGVCFTYAIVNFLIMMGSEVVLGQHGKISTINGQHVLKYRGQVVRSVSDEEFQGREARIARGFSGHWMLFYGVSFVGLYDGIRRERAARASQRQSPGNPDVVGRAGTYELAPTPRLTPWMHATVSVVVMFVGFFAVQACLVWLARLVSAACDAHSIGGCFWLIVPLLLASAITGFLLSGRLMSRYIAAACPACGGRAYSATSPLNKKQPPRYICRDCGRACGIDGTMIE